MIEIKVLGSGCANCQRLEVLARRVSAAQGLDARIEKITDVAEMMKYGILATPGLVINGRLVASGRVPQEREITGWLADAAAAK